jgi:hypothetical protein
MCTDDPIVFAGGRHTRRAARDATLVHFAFGNRFHFGIKDAVQLALAGSRLRSETLRQGDQFSHRSSVIWQRLFAGRPQHSAQERVEC